MKKCMCCMRDYSENGQECPLCGYSDAQMQRDISEFPEALHPETILAGRFILGRALSINDFSIIYISWDALLQRRVAIREYLPIGLGFRNTETGELTFGSDQELKYFELGQASFEEEAALLNENQDIDEIVHVYRTFRENNTSYLVMEYLEGTTIRDRIDEGSLSSKQQIDGVVRDLGKVIDQFHARGICHYNLTPENVFLDEDGLIHVTDFGAAKREVHRILGSNANILDLRYAAPEVLSGENSGIKSDMYSLGAIYYRLVTGKEPPQSRSGRKKKGGLKVNDPGAGPVIAALTVAGMDMRPAKISEVIR